MTTLRRCIAASVAALLCTASLARSQARETASGFSPLDPAVPPPALVVPITLHLDRSPIRVAVNELARLAQVSVVFDPSLAGLDRTVSVNADRTKAASVLVRLLDGSGLRAMVSSTGSIVLMPRPQTNEDRPFVAGTVRQPSGPLGGVHVALAGTRFETATDPAGRFTFGLVPRGKYMLRALRMGFAPINEEIEIGAAAPSIELSMIPAAVPVAAVIVTPGYFGVMQPGMAAGQALSRQQIETVPQLGEDVYRAVGRLPGVAMDDFSAKFSVRGASGDGLAVTLDGLPLVEPFHLKEFGNALSIVDLWSLGGAELITGGPSSEYGDEIGGVFRLRTMEPRGDRLRGSVGLSLTNFRGGAQGAFADGKGSWLVGARRGYLDLAFKLAGIEDSVKPSYNDGFAKVAYALPGGGQLAAHVLHAGDAFVYRDTREPSLESHYASDYGWLTLSSRLGERVRQEGVMWLGRLDWSRSGLMLDGAVPAIRIDDRRGLHTVGLRDDWSIELGKRALLKFGGTLRHETASYDYSKLFRRDVVENHMIVRRSDSLALALDPTSDRVDAYLAQRIRPVDAITIEAGARFDRASHTGDALVSPRLNASWQPSHSTALRASWGRHVQSESVFGLQVQDGGRDFEPAERADQAVIGLEQSLRGGLSTRIEAYDRELSHLRPRYVNASTRNATFPEIERDRLLLAPTAGRSRGVEISVAREAGRTVDWSASYAISSATQQVAGAWIPSGTDQPRALNVDWSFHPVDNGWRLTLSSVWHSGWPYTPDVVKIDTIGTAPPNQGAYATWLSGPLYSERVPAYQRVDARWTRFIDTRSGRLSLFIEVYNLLNTDNLRERYTNVSINRFTVFYSSRVRSQLPRIPSFGFNWEF